MNYLVVSLLGEKKKHKKNLIILEILGTEADNSETKVEFTESWVIKIALTSTLSNQTI